MALKQIISKDDHVLFCGISPSGSGVKAAMRIPKHPELNMLIHLSSRKISQGKIKLRSILHAETQRESCFCFMTKI